MINTESSWSFAGKTIISLFILAGILGLARVFLTQDVVWVSDGLGWDGVHYDRLLYFFRNGQFEGEAASFPFCSRIGSALILSALPEYLGFYQFNLVFGVLFAVAIFFLARAYTGNNFQAIAAGAFVGLFLRYAPIKFTNYYPVYMDPPFMFLAAVSALFLALKRHHASALVLLVAIPFREAAFYIIPFIAVVALLRSDEKVKATITFSLIIVAALVLKGFLPKITGCQDGSQVLTAFAHLYQLLIDPNRFLTVLAGFSMTIGPLVLLMRSNEFFSLAISEKYAPAFFALFYFAALAAIGGSDVTRIYYSFVPFYVPIIFLAFSRGSLVGVTLALTGWLITNQVLNKYLQPNGNWPDNDISGAWSQSPDHGHPVVAIGILIVWIILLFASPPLERLEANLRRQPT